MNTIEDTLRSVDINYQEAETLLAFVLKKDTIYLKTHLNEVVDGGEKKDFIKLVQRREAGEPIAYLIRKKSFLDCDLKVNKNVLIPRFETETLVEEIIANQKKDQFDNLLEVGTGSGSIAICLAKHLNLRNILATDVSESALKVAQENIKKNNAKLDLMLANLLDEQVQDYFKNANNLLLVANLPYLPDSYLKEMSRDVKNFEPHLALFAKDNGLFLIKKLIEEFAIWLTNNKLKKYTIYLELEPFQTKKVSDHAYKLLENIEIKKTKDLKHDFRFLKISNF